METIKKKKSKSKEKKDEKKEKKHKKDKVDKIEKKPKEKEEIKNSCDYKYLNMKDTTQIDEEVNKIIAKLLYPD